MELSFSGSVFCGIGKGSYYVGHPEYQKRFEASLGYRPYPGTLNVRLDPDSSKNVKVLRGQEGVMIAAFKVGDEGFSSLNCFDGKMGDERVTLLVIDITHYNESVAELISPVYLRGRFGLKDGDRVSFVLSVPSPEPH